MTARDWVALLRRQILLVLAVIVLVPVGAFVFASVQHKEYDSTAQVLLSDDSGLLTGGNSAQVPVAVANEVALAESTSVRDRARQALPDAGSVTVTQGQAATTFTMTAKAGSSGLATRTAAAYVNAYLQERQAQADRSLAAIRSTLQRQLDGLSGQIAGLQQQIGSTNGDTSGLSSSRDSLIQQRTALSTQLGNLQVGTGSVASFIHVVSPPSVPRHPSSPTPAKDAAIGLVLGLLLALGLAFIVDRSGLFSRRTMEQAAPAVGRAATADSGHGFKPYMAPERAEPSGRF